MRFANNFHSWLRHSWKSLANRLTHDPKIVIHGNSCIILYISIALAMAILQFYTKPMICHTFNSQKTPHILYVRWLCYGVFMVSILEKIYIITGPHGIEIWKKMVTILQTTSWIFFFNENIVIPIKIVLKNVPESAVDSTGVGNGLLQTGE